jgi:hypothetical protein
MRVTQLDRIFQIYESVGPAVAALRKAGPAASGA